MNVTVLIRMWSELKKIFGRKSNERVVMAVWKSEPFDYEVLSYSRSGLTPTEDPEESVADETVSMADETSENFSENHEKFEKVIVLRVPLNTKISNGVVAREKIRNRVPTPFREVCNHGKLTRSSSEIEELNANSDEQSDDDVTFEQEIAKEDALNVTFKKSSVDVKVRTGVSELMTVFQEKQCTEPMSEIDDIEKD